MEEGIIYDKTNSLGLDETLEVPRERTINGTDAGLDRVKIGEVPGLLRDRIVFAATWGNLSKTAEFHRKLIDEYEPAIFSQHTRAELIALLSEGEHDLAWEKRPDYISKAKKLFNSIEARKRTGTT